MFRMNMKIWTGFVMMLLTQGVWAQHVEVVRLTELLQNDDCDEQKMDQRQKERFALAYERIRTQFILPAIEVGKVLASSRLGRKDKEAFEANIASSAAIYRPVTANNLGDFKEQMVDVIADLYAVKGRSGEYDASKSLMRDDYRLLYKLHFLNDNPTLICDPKHWVRHKFVIDPRGHKVTGEIKNVSDDDTKLLVRRWDEEDRGPAGPGEASPNWRCRVNPKNCHGR